MSPSIYSNTKLGFLSKGNIMDCSKDIYLLEWIKLT